jgi:simple sugar transport system permease protein
VKAKRRNAELLVVAWAFLLALAAGSALMLAIGKSPAHVWWAMISRVVGDDYNLGQVAYRATTLVCTGLAVGLAMDVGMFNIAAEGQMTAGVLAAAVLGAALPPGTPSAVAIPLCLLAAASAGGAVGGCIGALKVMRGAHEVISSIMLNALIAAVALWAGNSLLFTAGTTRSQTIITNAQLPPVGAVGSAANAMAFVALGLALGLTWLRSRTTWGQSWRLTGQATAVARALGVNTSRTKILVMAASGGLAGLAAGNLVLGHHHAFEEGLGRGLGFLGIAVALVGRLQPLGIVAAAVVLSMLSVGGLAVADMVPKELSEMLQALVILAIAVASPIVRRLTARGLESS